MARPLVIWGAKGHALVLLDFLVPEGFEPVAVFDNDPDAMSPVPGLPVRCGLAGLKRWRQQGLPPDTAAVVALGGDRGPDRLALQQVLSEGGCDVLTVVHPAAHVARTAELGSGTQVLAGGVVGAGARVGAGCIINTSASIDHECTIGDGAHIGPGATLAGCVTVGDAVFVGAGAVVLPRLIIAAGATVGAGAVVTRDVPAGAVVVGNPARARQ